MTHNQKGKTLPFIPRKIFEFISNLQQIFLLFNQINLIHTQHPLLFWVCLCSHSFNQSYHPWIRPVRMKESKGSILHVYMHHLSLSSGFVHLLTPSAVFSTHWFFLALLELIESIFAINQTWKSKSPSKIKAFASLEGNKKVNTYKCCKGQGFCTTLSLTNAWCAWAGENW